jgi:hypothetical protein
VKKFRYLQQLVSDFEELEKVRPEYTITRGVFSELLDLKLKAFTDLKVGDLCADDSINIVLDDVFNECSRIINNYFDCFLKKSVNDVFSDWRNLADNSSSIGGYGYLFTYPGTPPKYCILAEKYQNVIFELWREASIACRIVGFHFTIAESPSDN